MTRNACISIGVSSPEGLPELKGAVTAARSMADWAKKTGFESYCIVDISMDIDGNEYRSDVCINDLRSTFDAIFCDNDIIDHLVIFFAGHGLARGFENQQWLLSNWRRFDEESVNLSALVRKLQRYQPKRVSIFSDACRNIPTDLDDTNLGVGVLATGVDDPVEFYEDRFQATQFGRQAYMLPVDPPTCLFSNVVLCALTGSLVDSSETRSGRDYITTLSLHSAITATMDDQCRKWNIAQKPSMRMGFQRPNDIYARLPIDIAPIALANPPTRKKKRPMRRTASRRGGLSVGYALSIDFSIDADQADRLQRYTPDSGRMAPAHTTDPTLRSGRTPIDFDNETRPTHFETSTGMGVNGAAFKGRPIVSPWMMAEPADPGGHPDWWRFFDRTGWQPPRFSSSLLLPFGRKKWVGAAVYPGRIVSFSLHRGDSVSVIYRPPEPYNEPYYATELLTQRLINKMLTGTLTDEDRLEAATRARGGKHVDQMLGVIAGYLYEAVGDRDSIRRMAWFYANVGQPIPFDIAMLADLRAARDSNGVTRADIPAVSSRRDLRSPGELRHPEYFRSTPAVQGIEVAGGFPWLRQGWELLDGCTLPIEPALVAIAKGVAPAPFTTLQPDAGQELADLILAGKV